MADRKPLKLDTSTGEARQYEAGDTLGVAHGGTGLATVSAGSVLYGSALDTVSALAAGTNGHVLTMVAGAPAWQAPSGASNWLSWSAI